MIRFHHFDHILKIQAHLHSFLHMVNKLDKSVYFVSGVWKLDHWFVHDQTKTNPFISATMIVTLYHRAAAPPPPFLLSAAVFWPLKEKLFNTLVDVYEAVH